MDRYQFMDGVFVSILRSPIFFDGSMLPAAKYKWGRPFDIIEDFKGNLWFTSMAGIIMLDPQEGKWCKVATQGGVTEGKDHNIWVVYENILFLQKYVP